MIESLTTQEVLLVMSTLGLTHRQSQVMQLVVQGKDTQDVAAILGCRETTIKKHLENIYRTLNVQSRAAAIACVLKHLGLFPRDTPDRAEQSTEALPVENCIAQTTQ